MSIYQNSSLNLSLPQKTALVNGQLTATVITTNSVTTDKTYTCEFVFGTGETATTMTGSPGIDVVKLEATAVSAVPAGSAYTFTCTYRYYKLNHM